MFAQSKGRDAARKNETKLYIMEHFYRNTQVVEYGRMVDFIKDRPSNNYTGTFEGVTCKLHAFPYF